MARLSDRISGSPQDLSQYATKVEVAAEYATKTELNNPNLLINGGFDVWQRGTSFTAAGYTADRWNTGAGGATNRWQLQVLAGANATNLGTSNWMNWEKTVAGGNTGQINQKIENVTTGGGAVVTLSFWAREVSGASKDFTVFATQNFGTGGDPDTSVAIGNYTMGGSAWTYYTFTFTLPEISNLAVIGANSHLKIQFSPVNAADTFDMGITSIKLEEGSVATPYQARPIGEELALCQRYYEKSYNLDFSAGSTTGSGGRIVWSSGLAQNSGRWQTTIPFKVTKRTNPSVAIFNSSTGVIGQAFGYLGAATGTPMNAIYGTAGESMAQVSFEPRASQSGYAFHWIADAEL